MIIPKTSLYNSLVNRKDLLILAAILIPSFILRIYRLDYHNGQPVFDEQAYYQEAALSYLNGKEDPNFEHPPLGKEIIALGIKTFGDTPYGWRIPSVVFSILGNATIYFLFKELFKSRFVGGLTSASVSLDFLFFIHARLGTMEMIYLFFVWSAVYFIYKFAATDALTRQANFRYLALGSLFFGLAFSTKWTAVLLLIPAFLILLVKRKFRRAVGLTSFLIFIGGAAYLLTYLPYLFRNSIWFLINLQYKIFLFWVNFTQKAGLKLGPVLYILNHAFVWPLNPAWNYDSIRHSGGVVQVVWALYNPIIFFPSLFFFIVHVLENKLKYFFSPENLPTLAILASFVPWLFITRIQYTYYFLPAIPFLYSFLAVKLKQIYFKDRWLFASFIISIVAVFGYFYPLISNLPVPNQYLIFYPLTMESVGTN